MPTIKRNWPDIETDMMIIANWRLDVIRSTGLAEVSKPPAAIFPFICSTRVYITNSDGVLAMLPFDAYDEVTLITDALLTHIENLPLEVWILKDDQVIQFWEEPEPDHS